MDIIERDFSGAPSIIIPKSLIHLWYGMYKFTIEDECDLETIDGQKFLLNDEMDFDNPVTAYDHICNLDQEALLIELDNSKEHALYLYSEADSIRWIANQNTFCYFNWIDDDEKFMQDLQFIDHLEWEEKLQWTINDHHLYIMNSACHGGDPELTEADFIEINITPGKYKLVASLLETDHGSAGLYQLKHI